MERKSLKFKSYNLDRWGMNSNSNILFITGLSGSGKSSLAYELSSPKTITIHLDLYLEKEHPLNKNTPFYKYLVSNGLDITKLKSMSQREDISDKSYWIMYDKFFDLLIQYGSYVYPTRKVIVEGVQLLDDSLEDNIREFIIKSPVVIMKTSKEDSIKRGMIRDGATSFRGQLSLRRKHASIWLNTIRKLEADIKDHQDLNISLVKKINTSYITVLIILLVYIICQ